MAVRLEKRHTWLEKEIYVYGISCSVLKYLGKK